MSTFSLALPKQHLSRLTALLVTNRDKIVVILN